MVCMGNRYNHLSYEDRVNIELLHRNGASIRSIAKAVGRSPNTISYELTKLRVAGEYVAKKASIKAYQKRYYSKTKSLKVAKSKDLRDYIDSSLNLGWSPKVIAGETRLGDNNLPSVSATAIYRYIKLYGLTHKLYYKGKTRHRKYIYKRSLLGERKWLEERILSDELGHYELDFIVSRHSSSVLMVAVDTKSKLSLIELLPNRTTSVVASGLRDMFKTNKPKTILTDNDIAFKHWRYFEKLLNAPFYFTHPYHSWEKGLVENTNKWIRHFIPKKTDLSTVTKETINQCLSYLNDRPRGVLNYRTASAVYYELLTSDCPT
jgi:transposase, IS30 family